MIVLQVCAYTAQYGGNFIASLTALEKNLKGIGIETQYLFPDTVKSTLWCLELQKRAKVFFAGINRFSFATYRQVQEAMKDASIVHSHFELYDCITAIARNNRQKLFWHLHDSFDDAIDFPHRIINKIQYKYLSKNVTLISPNDYYADYVVKLGFNKHRVLSVNNCIDTGRLKLHPTPPKKYNFFVFGGFYHIKGLDTLLDACRILTRRNKKWTLGIVGYQSTWKWIDENYPDLSPHIERLCPCEDVSDFYNQADVFLCPSRRENFSYALLEALYMEKPAITSLIPGNRWAISYQTVKPFQSENAEELAHYMEQFLLKQYWFSQDDLSEVSDSIKQCYDIAGWVSQIERAYFDD